MLPSTSSYAITLLSIAGAKSCDTDMVALTGVEKGYGDATGAKGLTVIAKDYGGVSGGIVWLFADDLVMNGTALADDGNSNENGVVGSGSILVFVE